MERQKSGYRTSWEIFVDSPDVEIHSLLAVPDIIYR